MYFYTLCAESCVRNVFYTLPSGRQKSDEEINGKPLLWWVLVASMASSSAQASRRHSCRPARRYGNVNTKKKKNIVYVVFFVLWRLWWLRRSFEGFGDVYNVFNHSRTANIYISLILFISDSQTGGFIRISGIFNGSVGVFVFLYIICVDWAITQSYDKKKGVKRYEEVHTFLP